MTATKHVFRQDAKCLSYAALGDTAVRIISIDHLIKEHKLDAIIVPQKNEKLLPLWESVFPAGVIYSDPSEIPSSWTEARVTRPTSLDWAFGSAGWNVFESVMWENGFFHTSGLKISPPIVFPSNRDSRAAMIYPIEHTDGNRIYDSAWWLETCVQLREMGYAINLLGDKASPKLSDLFTNFEFSATFPATISGLRDCVSASSIAIGGSTGPTWVLLMSDIDQIVLESKKSPHGYWNFDRCQTVLMKKIKIAATIECMVPQLL